MERWTFSCGLQEATTLLLIFKIGNKQKPESFNFFISQNGQIVINYNNNSVTLQNFLSNAPKKRKKKVEFFLTDESFTEGISDGGRSKEAQLNEKSKTYILIYGQLRGFQ